MTEHDPFNPPQVPVDRFLQALILDRAAWGWWSRGYGTGYEQGYAAGMAAGYESGLRLLDEAGALLATQRPDQAIPITRLRKIRSEYKTPALSADEIRSRAAASWGDTEDTIARGA